MYSFAYLAGIWVEMKRLLEAGMSFISDEQGRLFVHAGPKKALRLYEEGQKDIVELEYQKYPRWKEVLSRESDLAGRISCSQELLGLPAVSCFEEALGLMVVEEEIERSMSTFFDNSSLGLVVPGIENRTIPISKLPDYDTLVAAHCVRRGYIINEVAGRHFLLQGPTGLKHVTTAFNCTCSDFATRKDCEHVRLVKIIMFSYHRFYKYKVVNLLDN